MRDGERWEYVSATLRLLLLFLLINLRSLISDLTSTRKRTVNLTHYLEDGRMGKRGGWTYNDEFGCKQLE